MAKSSQTFRKRQREHKVREKAQLKRERREQRRKEKRELQALAPPLVADRAEPGGVESVAADDHRSLEVGANAGER